MSSKTVYPRFVMAKDDFYDDPMEVYHAAMSADYYEPKYYTGLRSRDVYHQPGVKKKLERLLGIKITRFDRDPIDENGVFYCGYAKGNKKEVPGVHYDHPHDDITVVIYLTPDLSYDCGTSLWMHRQTGITDCPTAADARRMNMKLADLRQLFESDAKKRSKWQEIDRIGYRFNRMVAYPSGVMHSATNHFGGHINDVRLYQTFRIGVDWNSFRMK